MPSRPICEAPSTSERLLQYGTVAAGLLRDIADATNTPYLKVIAGVSLMIMEAVQVWIFYCSLTPGSDLTVF